MKHIITDVERATFKLNESQLKDAVGQYFGKRPNDAFLHSTTPWGDLYRRYKLVWFLKQQVVKSWRSHPIRPVALATKTLENTSNFEGEFTACLSESVSDTVTTSWNMQHTVLVNKKNQIQH